MLLTFTWLAVAITTLVVYLCQVYSKFSRLGVNHAPVVPFFGNIFWVLFRKQHMIDSYLTPIRKFPKDKVVGHYSLVIPKYIICDVETAKRITIKDFEYFVDRRPIVSHDDPTFGRGLLNLTGVEWKTMRSTLIPAFSSSKIRLMVPLMMEVGEEMIKALKKRIKDSGKSYIDIETKDLATRYANDVIATCAFGLKVNSQTMDNQFYVMSNDLTTVCLWRILKIYFYKILPNLAQMIKMTIVPQKIGNFFRNLVLDTMKNREDNNIIRNDMINVLMEVKKEWTDQDLVAQALLFLFAGFATVSTQISFILHELALNPQVQEKLVNEFREYDAKSGGKFDYNSIQDMPYLDMVVSEGLRLWPAGVFLNRSCVKDYNIGRPNNKATQDLIIRKNECVIIPVWAFHRNPDFYPNPLKFDPERFSPENRHNIKVYMPFGIGPRNCIGGRFAMCEMKVMLYQLIREIEIYPCEKTCLSVKMAKDGFNMKFEGGAWVGMRVRSVK